MARSYGEGFANRAHCLSKNISSLRIATVKHAAVEQESLQIQRAFLSR